MIYSISKNEKEDEAKSATAELIEKIINKAGIRGIIVNNCIADIIISKKNCMLKWKDKSSKEKGRYICKEAAKSVEEK